VVLAGEKVGRELLALDLKLPDLFEYFFYGHHNRQLSTVNREWMFHFASAILLVACNKTFVLFTIDG
jgi:hypothetical protein